MMIYKESVTMTSTSFRDNFDTGIIFENADPMNNDMR